MNRVALLVQLEAKDGKEVELESFLRSGLPLVQDEPETISWFAIRMNQSTFVIFDTFPGEPGRKAHLAGKVAEALMEKAPELLKKPPTIEQIDLLASKLENVPVNRGLLVRLKAKKGKEVEVREFLNNGLAIVQKEPGTTTWFAFQINESTFGIYDAFSDESMREAHLNGKVAKALMANAPLLLETSPVIEKLDILAAKLK